MSTDSILDKLRFPLRTAAFAGLTFGMYGMLEADTAISSDGDRERVLYKWILRYGRALLRLYGVHVIAKGPYMSRGEPYPGCDARGKGRVFIMNHRSGLDIPINLAYVEATIVSRADLAQWPVIGVAARRVGTLFVDRSDKRSGTAVISAMQQAIDRGRGVMVYPEGTTFPGDEVRPFRPGAFLAAQQTGAEIVPVGIAYSSEGASFVEESFTAHMRRVSSSRVTRAAIEAGEPMAPQDMQDIDGARTRARDAVQALVDRARRTLQEG
jgi:1-acyl-sn-glycerol-3-phosphate acyltransferase